MAENDTPEEFEIPEGCIGLVGSPGEFARAAAAGAHFPATQTLVSDDRKSELRVFALPLDAHGVIKAKVPGYNIRVLRPGSRVPLGGGQDG